VPLIAFGLEHERSQGSDASSAESIPVCVLHPDSPQEHAVLHVPAPFGVVSAGAGSGGSSGSHLAGLAWAPNGSPLALLTATQQGVLHAWTQLPSQPDAEQPLTADDWSGESICDVRSQPVTALWLTPPEQRWQWQSAAAATVSAAPGSVVEKPAVECLESLFQPRPRGQGSNLGGGLHWVRPGALVTAVITITGHLTVAWRCLPGVDGERWQHSAPLPLLPAAGCSPATPIVHADVQAGDGGLHVLLVEKGSHKIYLLGVKGDPTAPSKGSSAMTAELDDVLEFQPDTELLGVAIQCGGGGGRRAVHATLGRRGDGSVTFALCQQVDSGSTGGGGQPCAASFLRQTVAAQTSGSRDGQPQVQSAFGLACGVRVGPTGSKCCAWLTCGAIVARSDSSLPCSEPIPLPPSVAAVAVCPTGSSFATLHRAGGDQGGYVRITQCATMVNSLEHSAAPSSQTAAFPDPEGQQCSSLSYRLAWGLVAGAAVWGAEAAARGLPLQQRRTVFGQLDAWLHAGAHFTRSHYSLKLSRQKLRMLREARDPGAELLAADLLARVSWEVADVATKALVPSGETSAAIKHMMLAQEHRREDLEAVEPTIRWANDFLSLWLHSLRRWCSVASAAAKVPPDSEAAAAAAEAAQLPAMRLLADRTFVNRAYQAHGRLLVVALMLAQAQPPSPAAEALASRSKDIYQGVRLVTGLITKHTPTPVDADGVAGLAAALASFPGEDPLHYGRPAGLLPPDVLAPILQELPCFQGTTVAGRQELREQAQALRLIPGPQGGPLLAAPRLTRSASQAAAFMSGLKPLPPLHQSAFDFKRVSGGASSQPSWQSLAPLDGNAGADGMAQVPSGGGWSVESLQARSGDTTSGPGGASQMQRKRWRAEAAVALGIMPAGSLWAGCRDAVSQVPLPAGLLPSHVAVDGSCASAALDNGGFLTQPWLAASPFTGAPWKRARTDPYHGL